MSTSEDDFDLEVIGKQMMNAFSEESRRESALAALDRLILALEQAMKAAREMVEGLR